MITVIFILDFKIYRKLKEKNTPNAILHIRGILLYLAFLNVENTPALTPAASALARAI